MFLHLIIIDSCIFKSKKTNKTKKAKKQKSAARSCYATNTFPHCAQTGPESTRTRQQHVVFERAEQSTEKEEGRFARLNIYSVFLSWEAESMNGWTKNQNKKWWPAIYCMPMKSRLMQTTPIKPLFSPKSPSYITPLCSFVCSVQMHPLIVLSMPSLLSDGLSSHQ